MDDGPCVSYIGTGGSGNYVKMVHNGIEYGDMELIAEAYDLLKRLGGLSNDDLHHIFRYVTDNTFFFGDIFCVQLLYIYMCFV